MKVCCMEVWKWEEVGGREAERRSGWNICREGRRRARKRMWREVERTEEDGGDRGRWKRETNKGTDRHRQNGW